MIHQINYKYIHDNGKIRSAAIVVDAKDVHEARKLANVELKKASDHFEITSIKLFGGKPTA